MEGKITIYLKMEISIKGSYETFNEIRNDVLDNCIGNGITASDREMKVDNTHVEKLVWTPTDEAK